MKRQRIAPEVKEQIISRIKNDGVSVVQAAKDHGISETTIYGWIAKKTEGQPTLSELIKLKRENEQLLRLVGDITLKLTESQKRSCDERKCIKDSASQRAWCISWLPVLHTQET